MGNITFLDPCPDSVWAQLPGGPQALNDTFGEVWQYMGTVTEDDRVRHEFRHRAHPLYGHLRVYAHVLDGDVGPRLGRLVAEVDNDDVISPPFDATGAEPGDG